MKITSAQFKTKAHEALSNEILQRALKKLERGFVTQRAEAIANLPEFNALRDKAVNIKNHTLQNLDFYLEHFANQVEASGGQVHWAIDAKEACQKVLEICQKVHAENIVKSKSMLTEEINLNETLEKAGLSVTETDLGEYIIQKRHEQPSHIVAPAIHLIKKQISKTFKQIHSDMNPNRSLEKDEELLEEARQVMRKKFFNADVGITGANFLIANTGTTVLVTNEGNADLTQTLPKTHIVVASIEKMLPSFEDATQFIRLLSRSATGQAITSYVTFTTGPKRADDVDGPEQFHVILVDNGRSKMLGGVFQDMLRCIRCGACLNHCPVYEAVGGQAYGSMYPGPMGAVLTPSLFGINTSKDLPNASTFCGRCESVCPLRIPLPKMMRHYREQEFQQHLSSHSSRMGLKSWAFLAAHPLFYRKIMGITIYLLNKLSHRQGRFHKLLFARAWTQYRDFPAPLSKTFQQLWETKKNKIE
jgi:L-lactate dehydrogenase complex protein LldF